MSKVPSELSQSTGPGFSNLDCNRLSNASRIRPSNLAVSGEVRQRPPPTSTKTLPSALSLAEILQMKHLFHLLISTLHMYVCMYINTFMHCIIFLCLV